MAVAYRDLMAPRPAVSVAGGCDSRAHARGLRLAGVPQRPRRQPAVVYRRRRIGVALATIGLLVIAGCLVVAIRAVTAATSGAPGAGVGAVEPVVQGAVDAGHVVIGPGDTLWELSGLLAPADTSRQEWVARVLAENGLDPLQLRPGTVVRLP